MKSVIASVVFFALTSLASQAIAECSTSLTAEQIQDCIVTENAGYYYVPRGKVTAMEETAIAPATANDRDSDDGSKKVVSATNKAQTN